MVIHDFSGHPFQVQLARHLARRDDFDVVHLFCASFQTPHGDIGGNEGSRFKSVGIELRRPFAKYSAGRRALQELEYGWRLTRAVSRTSPRLVISANTPLLAALVFHVAMKLRRTPVIFWMQDVYSEAMAAHLRRHGGAAATALAWAMARVERWIARSSARVVVISEAFVDTLVDWGVPLARIDVVENWAPLEEVPLGVRPNAWSERHGIEAHHVVLLYAGTLGLKHRPELLLALAEAFSDDPDVRVVVASEGVGADWLRSESSSGLEQIPFQPYDELPDMLASADVLLVLLEPEAGAYSVPSKVLTYHCAGRPILGAMPSSNLASAIIRTNDSGVVVDPSDTEGFVESARRLIGDPAGRRRQGVNARQYAERTFGIDAITDRFVVFVDDVLAAHRVGRR